MMSVMLLLVRLIPRAFQEQLAAELKDYLAEDYRRARARIANPGQSPCAAVHVLEEQQAS
jgi:hypothetical protein